MKNELAQLIERARSARENLNRLTSSPAPRWPEILQAAGQLGEANSSLLAAALSELAGDTTPGRAE
jgi:hypothetical protein